MFFNTSYIYIYQIIAYTMLPITLKYEILDIFSISSFVFGDISTDNINYWVRENISIITNDTLVWTNV